MKKFLYFIPTLLLWAVVISCDSDDSGGKADDTLRRKVKVRIPQFVAGDDNAAEGKSRTVILTDPKVKYVWDGNESIGIYSEEGAPTPFNLTGSYTENEAKFSSAKEKLVRGTTYYSICPYNVNLDSTVKGSVPVSYEGQALDRFIGLYDTITHLSAYDFLYAQAEVPIDENSTTMFHFSRVGSLIRIRLDLPDAEATYHKIVLKAMEMPETVNQFVVGGQLDLATGVLSDPVKSPKMELLLGDVRPTEETGTVLYPAIMIYPGDKRYGFDMMLHYTDKEGVSHAKPYVLNGYIYKPNYYYQQVAIEQ